MSSWSDLSEYLGAKTLYSVGSTVCSYIPPLTSSTVEEIPFEWDMEPFSLIISLAIASLYTKGVKPCFVNHHVVWHGSMPCQVTKNTIMEGQGASRTIQNWTGGKQTSSRKVINYWKDALRSALYIYQPYEKQDKIIFEMFVLTLDGLKMVKVSYESEKDGTPEKITKCKALVKYGLTNKIELSQKNIKLSNDKSFKENVAKTSGLNQMESPRENDSKEKLEKIENEKIINEENTNKIIEIKKEIIDTKESKDSAVINNNKIEEDEKNVKSNVILTNLQQEIKSLWTTFRLQEINYHFHQAVNSSEMLRREKHFKVIFDIMDIVCDEFEIVLKNNPHY